MYRLRVAYPENAGCRSCQALWSPASQKASLDANRSSSHSGGVGDHGRCDRKRTGRSRQRTNLAINAIPWRRSGENERVGTSPTIRSPRRNLLSAAGTADSLVGYGRITTIITVQTKKINCRDDNYSAGPGCFTSRQCKPTPSLVDT
jgi:hypothetical protein